MTTTSRPVRFVDPIPDGMVLRSTGRPVLAVSPTGEHWVYNAIGGLRVRHIGGFEAAVITGTDATLTNPFFCPTGSGLVSGLPAAA
jgi:hypothetical protein